MPSSNEPGTLAAPRIAVNGFSADCIGSPPGYHASMLPHQASRLVKIIAAEAGFDRCGITRAEPIGRSDYLKFWLDSGRAGTMEYMHRNFSIRRDASELVPGAKSVIMTASLYAQRHPSPPEGKEPRGRVAMYAWGEDYHRVVRDKMYILTDRLRAELGEPFEAKVCVDTVPIVERELAAAAGIGWIGKNTLVLNEELGSFFFLGAIVTSLELAPDEPAVDHCGTCTACLDACPTDAFPAPYEMDASRCISYLTIEHRGEIDEAFHESMDGWVFGCDVCQDVCPYNRKSPLTAEPRFAAREEVAQPLLEEIISWSEDDYRRLLRGSAIKRAKLEMLKRNARIALQRDRTKSQ